MDQRELLEKGWADMLKDPERSLSDEPLTVHEIAFILEKCFEGLKDPETEEKMKAFYKACIEALRNEITYN